MHHLSTTTYASTHASSLYAHVLSHLYTPTCSSPTPCTCHVANSRTSSLHPRAHLYTPFVQRTNPTYSSPTTATCHVTNSRTPYLQAAPSSLSYADLYAPYVQRTNPMYSPPTTATCHITNSRTPFLQVTRSSISYAHVLNSTLRNCNAPSPGHSARQRYTLNATSKLPTTSATTCFTQRNMVTSCYTIVTHLTTV
ncbi:hypothetical protein Pcinc_028753 [Petrolisthes cinctipes]|uniref:Uncharacterized protein n=1 Tax=Petrolisthes cinctipes TaxID=88211 RepID=A0AAE1K6W1_PETCI|nr:hypothetical protein Pcinc_028753 [Petrolisthes cinctipes]